MVTAYCAIPHPTEHDLFCNRTKGNHANHSAYSLEQDQYVDWPNEDYTEPPEVARNRAQRESGALLRHIAARTKDRRSRPSESR